MKRLFKSLSNLTTASALLFVLTCIFIISALIPSIHLLNSSEITYLKNHHFFTFFVRRYLSVDGLISLPFFWLLPLLLFLGTIISIFFRLKSIKKRRKARLRFIEEKTFQTDINPSVLTKKLIGLRLYKYGGEKNGFHAKKGIDGIYASIVFHLGFALLFLAIFLSYLTRTSGELTLIEGREAQFSNPSINMAHKGVLGAKLPVGRVTLDRVKILTDKWGVATQYAAVMKFFGLSGERILNLAVNNHGTLGEYQITLHRIGLAPEIDIEVNRRKYMIVSPLIVLPPGKEDSIILPDGKTNLIFSLVEWKAGDSYSPIWKIRGKNFDLHVHSGREFEINGVKILLGKSHFWASFILSYDLGIYPFILSLIIMGFALIIRFIFYERRFRCIIENGVAELRGESEFFPFHLKGELKRIERILCHEIS